MADVDFQNEGTIVLMYPRTPAGKAWVADHIPKDAMTFGAAIVIEHRFAIDIIEGVLSDGLDIGRV